MAMILLSPLSEVHSEENAFHPLEHGFGEKKKKPCQISNRCAQKKRREKKSLEKERGGRRRGNGEDVEAAKMTHIGATRYEFAMTLLGLLAHGWGARGDGRCTVGYLG